jgi:hypothetical protein
MKTEVEVARMRNIIIMAWDFTGMKRVFAKGSGPCIYRLLEKALYKMERNPIGFSHRILCQEVQRSIKTCYKERKPSYGQAAKVVDIAMKVLVGYCRLPNERTARLIAPRLHAAIDNKILREHLKKKGISSLGEINEALYAELQSRLSKEAKHKSCSPIEYDDWLWRKYNVAKPDFSDKKKTSPKTRVSRLIDSTTRLSHSKEGSYEL